MKLLIIRSHHGRYESKHYLLILLVAKKPKIPTVTPIIEIIQPAFTKAPATNRLLISMPSISPPTTTCFSGHPLFDAGPGTVRHWSILSGTPSLSTSLTPSSFTIVPTPRLSVMVQLTQPERLTKNVSFGSTVVSPFTTTVTVDVSWLAAKFTVPDFDT